MTKIITLTLLCCSWVAGAPSASLFYNYANPAISFAAAEVHKAYAKRGEALVERELQAVSANGDGVRIVIAGDGAAAARLAGVFGVASLKSDKPQSHAIRRRGATLIILGADATGAMYGGLDVAEAIRLGSLAGTAELRSTGSPGTSSCMAPRGNTASRQSRTTRKPSTT